MISVQIAPDLGSQWAIERADGCALQGKSSRQPFFCHLPTIYKSKCAFHQLTFIVVQSTNDELLSIKIGLENSYRAGKQQSQQLLHLLVLWTLVSMEENSLDTFSVYKLIFLLIQKKHWFKNFMWLKPWFCCC